jgi:transposase
MIEYTEVIHSIHRRRRWTVIEKQKIIEETYHPGASVSLVARKYNLSPSQLFQWRIERQLTLPVSDNYDCRF